MLSYTSEELATLGDELKLRLKDNGIMSSIAFETWFINMTVSAFDGETVTLMTESQVKNKTIHEEYEENIKEILYHLLGVTPDVRYKVDANFVFPVLEKEGIHTPDEIAALRPDRRRDDDETKVEMVGNRITYNEDYTFENFIVGKSNEFAHAAAVAVSKSPGKAYNPLYIYGPSGLGKTHLMYAITNRVLKKNPEMNIIYIKGEEFTNQLIESIQKKRTVAFRNKYRKADMLLIDDVQFIAGREGTQEEFFHTFNALYEDHKQIILTSDKAPKEMQSLEDRIKSRFESGLLTDIQSPDYELRCAILSQKSKAAGLELPTEIIKFLAENIEANIRQLEGVIKKLGAKSELLKEGNISLETIRGLVPEYIKESESETAKVEKILEVTARVYNVPVEEMFGKKRTGDIKRARNVAMYIIRNETSMSLPAIGKLFNRDHSTVHSNIAFVENLFSGDDMFIDSEIRMITSEIRD